ncbi:hypothetical protein A5719_10305 [Mycolicibacterium peregrinum]|uniref:hypothetical protein n=1 Tax=Mycolicibacterium peregrinum TaxID=43304 RepID=UPI0007E9F56C|nr:hypothetical protein [Mycolicibacterium peregrinum]OBF42826.1 hypothetical protein A5719_10305 [Mycolicibacterium peregrinum]
MTTATSDTHKLGSDWRVRRDDGATSPDGAAHGPGEQWRTDRPNEAYTDPTSGSLGSDWRVQR